MALVLKRLLGPAIRLSAGEWSSETASGKPAIACPSCGEIAEVDRVLDGGLVSGVWSCPSEHCAVMEFLQLEAWGEAYV